MTKEECGITGRHEMIYNYIHDEADYELSEEIEKVIEALMPYTTKTKITIVSVPHEGGTFFELWNDEQ